MIVSTNRQPLNYQKWFELGLIHTIFVTLIIYKI